MKKQLVSLFAMASMVFASSCTSEEIVSQSTGNEVSVTFKTELRSDVKSRAVGENAYQIDQVEFAVYGESGYLSDLYKTVTPRKGVADDGEDPNKMYAEISVILVKGQTYSFAFWAQDKDYGAYDFTPATATVSVNYGQTANNYSADAFFAKINDFTVTGTFEQTVTLKRPFAQVNFLTTPFDLEKAKAAGFEPSQSSIVVENAATSLNLLDGSVSGSTTATFNLANIVEATETTTIKNSSNSYITWDGTNVRFSSSSDAKYACNFRYLATAYFLPTKATDTDKITASMSVVGNTSKTVDLTADDIDAQRNYRTNIYGNLLTSNGTFYVTVDPGFVDDYSYEEEDETTKVVGTIAEANALFAEGETNVTITEVPASASTLYLNKSAEDATVNFAFEEGSSPAAITIAYAEGASDTEKPTNVEVNGNAGDLVINAPNSTVALNGEYNSVTATTAANTLIVTKGSKITSLTLNAGSAEIYYGAVTTLTKAKGYTGSITWTVDSKEQLAQIATDVNAGKTFEGETVELIGDIDLENEEWTPIGLNKKRFMGTFDGQGHIISNFKITTADNGAQAALFGDVNKAIIKNFTVDNAQILYPAGYTGDFYGAAVVSQAYMVTLEKITVKNSTIQGNNKVAAILAHDADGASMIIEDCHVVDCTIETKNETDGGNAAGIVGSIEGNQDITKQTKSIKNSSVKNTVFNVVNSTKTGKRSNAQMVGTVIAYEQTLVTLENCVVEGNTFNQTGVTTYKTPYDGVFVGGARNDEAGKVVVNGKEYPIMPAYIGTTGYKSLALALAASNDGDEILLTSGEHLLSTPTINAANVSIIGEDKETCIVKITGKIRAKDGVTSLTLKNLTTNVPTGLSYDEHNFAWIHYLKNFSMINCKSDGRIRLNVYNAVIDNCEFNVTTSNGFDGYAIQYQGANNSNVKVSNSVFNTVGKAIVLYNEGISVLNLNVEKCTFNSSNTATDKAAIQMHSEYGISGTLTVNNSTATGFANVNNGLWNELNNQTGVTQNNFIKIVDGKVQGATEVTSDNIADVINNISTETPVLLSATSDISVSETLEIPEGAKVTFFLNGKTISGTQHKTVGAVLKNTGNMKLIGGTVKSTAANGGSAIMNTGTMSIEETTLNGAPNADESWPSYTVNNSGTLTITDATITSVHGAVCSYGTGAVLTLNNSTIDMNGIEGMTSHGLYTYDSGKIVVNGGTYKNNAKDQNSTGGSVINGNVEVSAGNFTGRIENYNGTPVLKGGTYSVNPNVKFVASGYTVIDNGNGTWTVK